MIEVTVPLAGRSYPVLVGAGARHRLAEVITGEPDRVAVLTQAGIPFTVDSGRPQETFILGAGETAKSLSSVEILCRDLVRFGLSRRDLIVGLGGGVVTDVAGFVAAIYHRGVGVIHVPTTLLGQIDAAIGGKTGVNLPEGKNLVGAFWQPQAVLCDTETLATLAPRDYRSGLGEMAKYAFLGVDDLGDLDLDRAVAACVTCKAGLVGEDEREAGRRALLNYGHTFAHAIETVGGYGFTHGEAVALGLVLAAELAHRLGRIDAGRVAVHRRVVAGYDLPMTLPPGLAATDLIDAMARDKKATGPGLTFVLDGPTGPEVVPDVPRPTVAAVLEAAGAS